ncbi:MAG: STAS domain-containing protein [Marinifilaceae bacterium]|nr:STAS domain-containing protein [Marinifilaceae bacterium]
MILNIKQQGNEYRIDVKCSRLTLAYSEELKDEVKPLLGVEGANVIIDLKGVQFIDSSGVGSLISLAKQAKVSNSTLTIENPEQGVKELFTLLRLDLILNIRN